jgi:hypothetical protein
MLVANATVLTPVVPVAWAVAVLGSVGAGVVLIGTIERFGDSSAMQTPPHGSSRGQALGLRTYFESFRLRLRICRIVSASCARCSMWRLPSATNWMVPRIPHDVNRAGTAKVTHLRNTPGP